MADLMQWLESLLVDPVVFAIVFFVFVVAATIVLPIPVELGLIIGYTIIPYPILALILGIGKGVGSLFVFEVGAKLEPKIRYWSGRVRLFGSFISAAENFVAKYRYYALYIILSIPLMLDTVPLYLFSLLNKDGKAMGMKWFALTNVAAGITRAAILGLLFFVFGTSLFG